MWDVAAARFLSAVGSTELFRSRNGNWRLQNVLPRPVFCRCDGNRMPPLNAAEDFCKKHNLPQAAIPATEVPNKCVTFHIPKGVPTELLLRTVIDYCRQQDAALVISKNIRNINGNRKEQVTLRWPHSGRSLTVEVAKKASTDSHDVRVVCDKEFAAADVNVIKLILYFAYMAHNNTNADHSDEVAESTAREEETLEQWIETVLNSGTSSQGNSRTVSPFGDQNFFAPFTPFAGDLGGAMFGDPFMRFFGSAFPGFDGFDQGRHWEISDSTQDDGEGSSHVQSEVRGLNRCEALKAELERMGASVHMPRTKENETENDEMEPCWADLAGYEDAKRALEEVLLLGLQYPTLFAQVTTQTRAKRGESNRPRAVLLKGPPGTGKTSAARVIAAQIKVPLVYVSLESIVSKWYGESERNMAAIFDKAAQLARATGNGCILFIDEIDALASSRDTDLNQHEASRRMLSILLRRLDGYDNKSHDKIILICATNREQDLDEAFRSRIDVSVPFPLPDFEARKGIIQRYAKQLSEQDLEKLAAATESLSGRNIKDLCQTAERRWVANLLRQAGLVRRDSKLTELCPEEIDKRVSIDPPPLRYYIMTAEEKQKCV